MEEIIYQKSYKEYKEELSSELVKTAESFVKIGYMLKVARDTDILKESGYDNMVEFAKAEYGIDKTQVSRFIRINDKFSEGGNSDHLLEEYQGFGYAKLALMLQLPDAVNEALTTNYSKAEIQSIKEEFDEERKVTDIERMIEETECDSLSTIEKVIRQLGETEPELFCEVCVYKRNPNRHIQELKDIMAPAEEKTYSVRVPGIGRIILMLSPSDVRMVNSRTGIKEMSTWEELEDSWPSETVAGRNPEEIWTELYCRPYPKNEKVAPVQQKKKDTKVKKAKPDAKKPEPVKKESIKLVESSVHKNEENPEKQVEEQVVHQEDIKTKSTEDNPEEEQLPGQMEVADYPEQLPEGQDKAEGTDEKPEESDDETAYDIPVELQIMSDNELEKLWGEIEDTEEKIIEFIDNTSSYDIVEEKVEAETIKKAYHDAVSLAAGLEKLMLEMKRRDEER